jgi:hypothetical protein
MASIGASCPGRGTGRSEFVFILSPDPPPLIGSMGTGFGFAGNKSPIYP